MKTSDLIGPALDWAVAKKGWTPMQISEIKPHSGNRVASKVGDEIDIPEELK